MKLLPGTIVAAPVGGRVDVLTPALSVDQPIEDCAYMPRGATDPAGGEPCLVAVDDRSAWVLAWEPA